MSFSKNVRRQPPFKMVLCNYILLPGKSTPVMLSEMSFTPHASSASTSNTNTGSTISLWYNDWETGYGMASKGSETPLRQAVNNVWCHRNHNSGGAAGVPRSDDSCPTLTRQPLPFFIRHHWPTAPDRGFNRSQLITFSRSLSSQNIQGRSQSHVRLRRSDLAT